MGFGQVQQVGSSGHGHSTAGAQRMTREADGSGNINPCPGHSQEFGQVHEATLLGLHPQQPWSHVLLTFCIGFESVSDF